MSTRHSRYAMKWDGEWHLTAATMIVGAAVILFEPIFQGLAISLMAGEVASLLLSRMAVPVLYYMAKRHERGELVLSKTPVEAAA